MDHLVSIIIPVYNGERHLKECLDSVMQQTHSAIEIIVVNDGSTDNTINILQNIKDERLTVLNTNKKGACNARNIGFESSKGEYVQFMDADDFISGDKIERQLNALRNTSGCVSVCDTVIVDEKSNAIGALPEQHKWLKSSERPFEFLIALYENYGMVQTNVWLSPRSIIIKAGNWNEDLKQDQDGEFFCRVMLASDGIKYAENCYNYYRKSNNSLSISNIKSVDYAKSTINALDLKTRLVLNRNADVTIKKIMAMHYKILAVRNFGVYPELYKDTINKCEQLGGTEYTPILGGRIIEFIKAIVGWRCAKRIALLKQRF